VPVEATVGSDSPRVSGWGWTGSDFARHNQCTVDCSLRRLERIGSDGSEISAGGGVDVNVKGLHGCGLVSWCERCALNLGEYRLEVLEKVVLNKR
jgi:hypothetical protein